MKVLVTGGSGLLGYHIIRTLHRQGHEVTAWLRRPFAPLDPYIAGVAQGDLCDPEAVQRGVAGQEALIHAAADAQHLSFVRSDTNQRMAHHLVEAALAQGLRRMVHVSTANTVGRGSLEQPGTEQTPFNNGHFGMHYIRAKQEAEDRVLHAVRERGLPALVVNPTFLMGPHDHKPSSGQVIVGLAPQPLWVYPPGGKNVLAAQDAATAIANALERGHVGERYLLGHENLSYRAFFTLILQALGRQVPLLPAPAWAVRALGQGGEWVHHLGGKSRLDRPTARVALADFYYDAQKAVRELGLPQSPVQQAIQEAVDWFREEGYL
jgi:dihydroflavonol-4-reductase